MLYFSSLLFQSDQTPALPLPSWAGSRASCISVVVVLVVLSSTHFAPAEWWCFAVCGHLGSLLAAALGAADVLPAAVPISRLFLQRCS